MKAKYLLSDKSMWTKGAAARDLYGHHCSPYSGGAFSFSALGAVLRAYRHSTHAQSEAIRALLRAIPSEYADVESWNDDPGRTFEDVRRVIALADAAASAAEKESGR
jgi:hypothetical protein